MSLLSKGATEYQPPSLRGLTPTQRDHADKLLKKADILEKSGMTSRAASIRRQVDAMAGRASNDDIPPSKRDRITQRQATKRAIKHKK